MRRRIIADPDLKEEMLTASTAGRGPGRPSTKKKAEGAAENNERVKPPRGVKSGAANPQYTGGRPKGEIKMSTEVFQEMKTMEDTYFKKIDGMAREKKWDAMKVLQIKSQASRVVRLNAILRSNYGRMLSEQTYRRKIQEPTTSNAIMQYEAQAQKQEAILFQMMGLDEMHEAKLGQVEAKSKPTDLQVIVGGNLSKKHMAAGG
jgi:hypothetical protein